MYKVVYNNTHGGFSLSMEAYRRLAELGGDVNTYDFSRHDKLLVQVVEELGTRANGNYASLAIKEISSPEYFIEWRDGLERVVTKEDLVWITIE